MTWPQWWQGFIDGFPGFAESCDKAFGLAEPYIPPRLFRGRAETWPATLASVERHNTLPKTLTHPDVHLGNWYIAGNGDMGVTDWQGVCVGHWSRDLAYALSTTLAIENRRAWMEDLIRLYIERMAEYGAPRIAYAEALLNVRQQLMTTLAWWTITLVPAPGMPAVLQPPQFVLELIKRITAAIDDLDALDSFA